MWLRETFEHPVWPWELPQDPDDKRWWQERLLEYVEAENSPAVRRAREREKKKKQGKSAKQKASDKGWGVKDGGKEG